MYVMMAEISKEEYDFTTTDLLGCDSDDERLYWWSEGAFDLSPECYAWLAGIKEKHKAIMAETKKVDDSCQNIKELMLTLNHIDKVFPNMFMFKDSFYDLVGQGTSIESTAAIKLLKAICLDAESKIETTDKEFSWMGVKKSKPRAEMKQYIALLGNRELRKNILSF